MPDLGFDRPIYVLPFDHRGSFQSKMFGWDGALTAEQTAEIANAKRVVYDGLLEAVAKGVPRERAGILVDEQFGADILREADDAGFMTAMPAEKSGQEEFDFEYGEDFFAHLEAFMPTFCKVLVRCNVSADEVVNARQAARLARLSDQVRPSRMKLMFELLVPATPEQLASVSGDRSRYDDELRPDLMVAAIEYFQDRGVEPDVWKSEGLDRPEDCVRIVAVTRREGRDRVGNIILGRGESEEKVREWVATAAGVPGYVGFAVGRTTFWNALVGWRSGALDRAAAVTAIAEEYHGFVKLFEEAGT